MLHYFGRHAPRKYTVPDIHPIVSPPRDPCEICLSRAWTSDFYTALIDLPIEIQSHCIKYRVSSQELRRSTLQGCKFCRTLADGIHGKLFYDDLYQRFRGKETGSVSAGTDNCVVMEDEIADQDAEKEEDDWNDASGFNEELIDNDPTDGWGAWIDHDTLMEACILEVAISFERGKEEECFTIVNVYIEAVEQPTEEGNVLQNLHGVELRYHISTDWGGLPELDKIFPAKASDSTLGSEKNMETIQHWVRSLAFVPQSSTTNSTQIPGRLIELQYGDTLRVCDSSSILPSDKSFAALSYVWGASQDFILLSTNIDSLMRGFTPEKLPQTIRDAVTVTRRVGLRYLWVDALCIIQDSDQDKLRELPNMGLIYKYATVTIVASVAKFATEGFLNHIAEQKSYEIDPVAIPYRTDNALYDRAQLVLSYPATYNRFDDPINDRAWTFQELMLSTRAILFTYRGIQTINRENIKPVEGPMSKTDYQLPNLSWSGKLFSLATSPENIRQVWLSARGEYSRRNITYQTDRLLAISAIAQEIGRVYQGRYLAGMWEHDLAVDLGWKVAREFNEGDETILPRLRAKEYVAPSWSWASVDGSVESYADNSGGETMDFQVVSCDVELAVPGFTHGAVKSGVLAVKGRICTCFWRWHPHAYLKSLKSHGSLATQHFPDSGGYWDFICGEATADALEPELQHNTEVMCLATRLTRITPIRYHVEGLMLLPVDGQRYRRVGFFTISDTAVFDTVNVQEITIV
ncbi:HET-domain-containing protein [Dothidotthia symphoricarpi CBS 119687]|uniref:HET-domain-containing protein n=1 Tax=Dothidotthia symphoricarpi CBS 119687 TaxID=1392245 RepID=A0A6A6A2V4_9PLEO|nr:HET-domain-containing protein [Dothidotthia symphoricarpi CBS 119687]KAF2124911.1 HET-domain-containing protein [Dothidotthia symphoricarpi CBS 119687]